MKYNSNLGIRRVPRINTIRISFLITLLAVLGVPTGVLLHKYGLSPTAFAVTADELKVPIITGPADNAIVSGNPLLTWEVPDPSGISFYRYESFYDASLKSRIFTENTGTKSSRNITGSQTIELWWRVTAVYTNGASYTSSSRHLYVDNRAPVVAALAADQHLSTTDATITGAVTETNLESVSLKLDGIAVDSTAITLTGNNFTANLQNLSIGSHTVEIIATDRAGNKSAPKTHTFTVTDNIAPEIAIDTTKTTFVEDEDVIVDVSATDNYSDEVEVTLSLDGVAIAAQAVSTDGLSHNFGKLRPGTYAVAATGSDEAGNESSAQPVTLTVTAKPVTPVDPVTPSTPDPETPAPAETPAPQPAPTRIAYLQPAANTSQVTADDAPTEEPTVEADALALNESLSERVRDIRGTTDSTENSGPWSFLGVIWYYWLLILATIIFFWFLLAAKKRQKDDEK